VSYKVELTLQAQEDISKLDHAVAERLVRKIEWLSQNFESVVPQPLKGKFGGLYKLVIGDWRVIYAADSSKETLTVHLARHRSEVYK
jgi:addiction module RelE/StbE family toxin